MEETIKQTAGKMRGKGKNKKHKKWFDEEWQKQLEDRQKNRNIMLQQKKERKGESKHQQYEKIERNRLNCGRYYKAISNDK